MAGPNANEDISTQQLNEWLTQHSIQFKIMHRDFSDAYLVAALLKKIHPTLVDMNNYPKRSNTELKRVNWDTLNSRVLSKIGLRQTRVELDRYASCTPGAIVQLLQAIMRYQKTDPATPVRRYGSHASQGSTSRGSAASTSRHSAVSRTSRIVAAADASAIDVASVAPTLSASSMKPAAEHNAIAPGGPDQQQLEDEVELHNVKKSATVSKLNSAVDNANVENIE